MNPEQIIPKGHHEGEQVGWGFLQKKTYPMHKQLQDAKTYPMHKLTRCKNH